MTGIIRLLTLLLAAGGLAAQGLPPTPLPAPAAQVLADSPLTLTAQRAQDWGDWAIYRLSLTLPGGAVCFYASGRGKGEKARLAQLQPRRRGSYLFIPCDCGGGNAWRCQGWVVVKLGKPPALLGYLSGGGLDTAFSPYQHGLFRDGYDRLEINPLTSHAAAPAFTVWMREAQGRLKPLAKETWRQNRADWARHWASLSASPPAQGEERVSALLYCAGLAQWCGRTKELAQARTRARELLDAKTRLAFEQEISQVRAGDLPDPRVHCGQP